MADWNRQAVEKYLTTRWAGRQLYFKEITDSTNTDVERLAKEAAPHGTVVIAGAQTAGKGRRGRGWDSPAGENIYFSVLLRPCLEQDKVSMVTLLMAMAVTEAVTELTGLPARIKWPNDVVIRGRKICGILTELCFAEDGSYYVVIGTGINCNETTFPEEIRDRATSLRLEGKEPVDMGLLTAAVLQKLEAFYERWETDGDLSGLRERYETCMVNQDARVRVLDPKGEYEGIARRITDTGELLVEKPDGSLEAVYAGEVSVRGIYGYV